MKYEYINLKSAYTKIHNTRLPYDNDLNIYRGCEHDCIYCFARYTSLFLNNKEFSKKIFIKKNINSILIKQLSNSKKPLLLNIGGISDCYQPIEQQLKIMPKIIRTLEQFKIPCCITTKSSLILRDYFLLENYSKQTIVNVAISLISTNQKLLDILEPYASSFEERQAILNKFQYSNVYFGIHIMPIIPYITDSYENLESIFILAKKYQVKYIEYNYLNLKGETKIRFFKFLNNYKPELLATYQKMYFNGYPNNNYISKIDKRILNLRKKYNIPSSNIKKLLSDQKGYEQLTLF